MAKNHTWVGILLRPLPCLYTWHARRKHACTFTSPFTRHLLPFDQDDGEPVVLKPSALAVFLLWYALLV